MHLFAEGGKFGKRNDSGPGNAESDARAVTLFKAVTRAQPDFAPAWAALGRTYVHTAQFQNRRADLVAAAKAAPEPWHRR